MTFSTAAFMAISARTSSGSSRTPQHGLIRLRLNYTQLVLILEGDHGGLFERVVEQRPRISQRTVVPQKISDKPAAKGRRQTLVGWQRSLVYWAIVSAFKKR